MIKSVYIKGFKCFDEENIEFSDLTVITGPNSSGKSSLLQALLLNLSRTNLPAHGVADYLSSLGGFTDLKNKNTNPKQYTIELLIKDNTKLKYLNSIDGEEYNRDELLKDNRMNIYCSYLSANRYSVSEHANGSNDGYLGIYAENLSVFYFSQKSEEIGDIELRHENASAYTLEAQVNYWLAYICDTAVSFYVDEITSTLYRAYYKINNQEYKPQNLGSGISYLIAILVSALLMKKWHKCQILIIENPEIHLHPKSQARLAKFFAFVAKTGRQLIIETHSEHLISKLRYCVYEKEIDSSQVIIHYKQPTKFEKIEILPNGKLLNEQGENSFPHGFFDATLDGLFKINANV